MKLVIQRVSHAEVNVNGNKIAEIKKGFLVLLGVAPTDTDEVIEYLVKKLLNLRIFEDENGKMNLSIQDVEGELLIVSQFTLYADCKKGNRPSFTSAAEPKFANEMYEKFIIECKKSNLKVQNGSFGADMKVSLLNDGPVTIILENEIK